MKVCVFIVTRTRGRFKGKLCSSEIAGLGEQAN